MTSPTIAYIIFGSTLVVLFTVIIVHYYSKKRHKKVEQAKYRMLEDDE
jgi:cbb3-type cytochrome oxidase subunit 3